MKINTRLVQTQHEETTRLSKSSASTTSTALVNLCVVISVVFYLMPQPPERPKHVRVWTPRLRLYTEDEAVFLEEPFATELVSTLCEPRFIEHLTDWLCFTLGAEITEDLGLESLVPGQELFVDVLFTRYLYGGTSEGDTIAYKLLEAAQIDQVKYYRGFGDTPADFSLAQDFDARETLDSDSEHESDWEGSNDDDVLMDDTDTDYVPEPADESMGDMSPPPSDSESDLDLPCFVRQPTHKKLRVVPKVPLLPPDDQSSQICRWIHHIQEFFYSDVPGVRDSRLVVDDLVEMRAVPARVYNSEAFQCISEESGLIELLHKIARPGNLIETTQVDIEESFRWWDWKIAYAELIVQWLQPVITEAEWEEVRPKTDDPKFQFDAEKARGLLKFISDRPEMHPWGFNPMAVYLFLSLGCFSTNCETWLLPALRELHYPFVDGWNCKTVYRELMHLTEFTCAPASKPLLQSLDERLALIIQETGAFREYVKSLETELYRFNATASSTSQPSASQVSSPALPTLPTPPLPAPISPPSLTKNQRRRLNKAAAAAARALAQSKGIQQHPGARAKKELLGKVKAEKEVKEADPPLASKGCSKCAGLPDDQHCIRLIWVTRRNCAHLIGGALTCAPPGSRLRPKSVKRKKGAVKRAHRPVKYYHPLKDLKMEVVEHRPDVYERCGKDIVRFMYKHVNTKAKMVGGVRFKAFSDKTLEHLIHNHRLVKVRAIRRCSIMQRWAYGSMTATGSRQASGGRRGDTYSAYACHRGDTPDDIKALFSEAMATDTIIAAGNTICPGLKTRLEGLTATSGVNYLGRTSVSNFTCSNYISCIHPDSDFGLEDLEAERGRNNARGDLSPCVQLVKSGCGPDDYNFAYVRWGVVVRTMANTVWYVTH
ncbi:hypothetical protein B0H14DRAFT_3456368 [Mycena olivaceomarginata]|nr:hypothetical protein B0H14DRAFT_3456368 [Mycena olivaceomarginata]